MGAFPHLPLFTDAFLADTTHLNAQETGAYLMLLMIAWRSSECRLPDDDDRLARWARVDRRTWQRIKPTIMEFWTHDGGFWIQRRLSKEREIVSKRAEVARHNGQQGGRPNSLNNNDRENPVGSSRVSREKAPIPIFIRSSLRSDMSEPDGSNASVPIGSVSRDLPDEGTPPCAAASPDGPPAPAAPRKRLAYPVEFDALWAAYPTDPNMSKSKALDAWKRLGPDDRRAAMASIPGFRAYCRKNPTYRPVHLVRFITDRRFDGFVSNTAPPGSATPAGSVAELTPEQRGNAQRSLVRDWQNSPFGWPYKLGPKPDEPGCQIPPEILAEFDLGPLAAPPRRAVSA